LNNETLFVLQALGAGMLEGPDNELIEAPEDEDEFDVLNDETFGNCDEAGMNSRLFSHVTL
jgi:hypothetical protein